MQKLTYVFLIKKTIMIRKGNQKDSHPLNIMPILSPENHMPERIETMINEALKAFKKPETIDDA